MRSTIVYAVYLPTFLLAVCRGLLIPVLPLYAATFQVSYGLVGLALASEGLGTLVADLPVGLLLARLGHRRAMVIGIGGMALGSLAYSWASSFVELILYGMVVGASSALWNVARHAYLTTAAPVGRRGRAIALFGGINRIGAFAGPLLGGFLGGAFGLRSPFLLYGALALIALLFPLRYAENNGVRGHGRGGVRGHSGHLWRVFRQNWRTLVSAGSGQIFAQTIRSGRNIIIPLYAADILGLDVEVIGLIVGIAAAVDMSMFYPAGYVMDRFGRKFAYVPSFTIQALGMALVPLTGSFGGLLLVSSLIGLGNGLGSGTMMTLGADLAPRETMGEFLGIWRLIGDGGSTGGPLVVGTLADLAGLSPAIFAIAGIGLLAAVGLGTLVPETLRRQPQAQKNPP